MYQKGEDPYYLINNENIFHPPMPGDVEEGIIRGLHPSAGAAKLKPRSALAVQPCSACSGRNLQRSLSFIRRGAQRAISNCATRRFQPTDGIGYILNPTESAVCPEGFKRCPGPFIAATDL
jgi:hypothetical protein